MKSCVFQVAVKGPFLGPLDYMAQTPVPVGVRVKVPLGRRQVIGLLVAVQDHSDISVKLKSVEAVIDESPVISAKVLQLLQRIAEYYHQPLGLIIDLALPKRLLIGQPYEVSETTYQITDVGQAAIQTNALVRAPKQASLLGQVSANIITETFVSTVYRALKSKGYIKEITQTQQPEMPAITPSGAKALSTEQAAALDWCLQAQSGDIGLLEGITGSGKTEVYLQWLTQVIAQGKQALVLVPEIGLIHQTLQRLQARLQVPVACYHSGMTNIERLQTWYWAHHGQVKIVLGTRSAMFLPFANLGAIVVDEVHDASYQQQTTVYFSARDMLLLKAQIEMAPILLASATPPLEMIHAVQVGRYHHMRLSHRHGGAQLPEIQLIDMRQQPVEGGLSHALRQAMRQHLSDGGQVLLFLNRRGFSPVLLCHACGWAAKHAACDRHFTWHQRNHRLACHHCDVQMVLPKSCPQCGAVESFIPVGVGTEQIETVLSQQFSDKTTVRIDRDTMRHKGDLEAALKQVHDHKADIIIGTQMIAKGHHFKHVTMVAVVDIDSALYSLDFRAIERLAQLVTQVAGRAGRDQAPGTLYLQTHQPEHGQLRLLLKEGYGALANELLKERQLTHWPPYGHLAILRAESKSLGELQDFLKAQKTWLQSLQLEGLQVWGPVPALLAQRSGVHRQQLLLQADGRKSLHAAISVWQQHNKPKLRVQWLVDPQEM